MRPLLGHLPSLTLGPYQIPHYDEPWLEGLLMDAARRSSRKDLSHLTLVRSSLFKYLRDYYLQPVLSVADLFSRVRELLYRTGLPEVAAALHPLPPPVTVSLLKIAEDAGPGYELSFFTLLDERLRTLREAGAGLITFKDLERAALLLRNRKKPNLDVLNLSREITAHLHHRGAGHAASSLKSPTSFPI